MPGALLVVLKLFAVKVSKCSSNQPTKVFIFNHKYIFNVECLKETRTVYSIEESRQQNPIVTDGKMVVLNLREISYQNLLKGVRQISENKMKTAEQYSKKADEFILAVSKYIEETQGAVPAEYQISLMMLRNNLYYYMQAYDSCIENGLVYSGKDGRQYVTQTWHVLQDTEKRMMEILKQFGLTTMSRSKIKLADGGMTAEQLLNNLIEG